MFGIFWSLFDGFLVVKVAIVFNFFALVINNKLITMMKGVDVMENVSRFFFGSVLSMKKKNSTSYPNSFEDVKASYCKLHMVFERSRSLKIFVKKKKKSIVLILI